MKTKTLVNVFREVSGNDRDDLVFTLVEQRANDWLAENPLATIIASHTNLFGGKDWTEFVLTLIVLLPVEV